MKVNAQLFNRNKRGLLFLLPPLPAAAIITGNVSRSFFWGETIYEFIKFFKYKVRKNSSSEALLGSLQQP